MENKFDSEQQKELKKQYGEKLKMFENSQNNTNKAEKKDKKEIKDKNSSKRSQRYLSQGDIIDFFESSITTSNQTKDNKAKKNNKSLTNSETTSSQVKNIINNLNSSINVNKDTQMGKKTKDDNLKGFQSKNIKNLINKYEMGEENEDFEKKRTNTLWINSRPKPIYEQYPPNKSSKGKKEDKKNIQNDEDSDDMDTLKIDDISNEKNKEKKPKKKKSLIDENGKLTIKLDNEHNYCLNDFEVVGYSGRGAYGTVLQVQKKNSSDKTIYAIKKLDIYSLNSVNRLYQAYLEYNILKNIDCPYIVKTQGAFVEDGKIHIIMDYLEKGDLSYFIKHNFPLNPQIIQFYSAEIVLFLEYMQKKKLIHRDLKPQNIMIDGKGHLKVIDFGTIRKLGYIFDKKEMKFIEEKNYEKSDVEDIKGIKTSVNPDYEDEDENNEEEEDDVYKEIRGQRRMTFVGTAEYISPEVIKDLPAEYGTDIWAFAVILYQMIYNNTPFRTTSNIEIFKNIKNIKYSFPNTNKIDDSAKDLISKIFVIDPKKRLGGGPPGSQFDIEHLKSHKFFNGIKWSNMNKINPPNIQKYQFYEGKKMSVIQEDINSTDAYEFFGEKPKKKIEETKEIKILKKGEVKLKTSWLHYVTLQITLDNTPKLKLTGKVKGQEYNRVFILNSKFDVHLKGENSIILKYEKFSMTLKIINDSASDWASAIKDASDSNPQ